MKISKLVLLGMLSGSFALAGCKSKDGDSSSSKAWPAQPADGTPIVAEFIAMQGSGEDIEVKLRLFNFADKAINSVRMTLNYLDATGKELKDFPWSQAKAGMIGKKGTAEIKAGAFIPAETKSVSVEFRGVEYADGTKWERP